MAQHYDFKIYIEDDTDLLFVFTDDGDEPLQLSADGLEMLVHRHYQPSTVVDKLTVENGRLELVDDGFKVIVHFSPEDKKVYAKPRYPAEYFDYTVDYTEYGKKTRLLYGHIYPLMESGDE